MKRMRTLQGRRVAASTLVALGCAAMWQMMGCAPSPTDANTAYPNETGGSGTGGTGGNSNVACDEDPTTNPGAVIDDCGVFISTSASENPEQRKGTKESPFKTFAEAAARRGNKRRVYVCADAAEPDTAAIYKESSRVDFSDGVEIYGGFTECNKEPDNWVWSSDKRATLVVTATTTESGSPSTIALTLNGGANQVQSLNVIANGAATQGNSSVALLVNGGTADIVNTDLTAGDAGDGDPGVTPTDETDLNGIAGSKGDAACDPGAAHPGKDGPVKQCPGGESSAGGKGGAGSASGPAGSGGDGTPESDRGGAGGQGAQSASMACTDGANGEPGKDGTPGDPIEDPGLGTIDATGYHGVTGVQGRPGAPGQGGGGGGGALGGTATCPGADIAASLAGASGGTGGSGGCGGRGGEGGKPGGSSIAVLILNAEATFHDVQLTAGNAGDGGAGGDGALGGTGGLGGDLGAGVPPTLRTSCRGGSGGDGGLGGPGGGGSGGHSLGIVFKGNSSLQGEVPSFTPGSEGQGGPGGSIPSAGAQGASGRSGACLNFDTGDDQGCLK
ncbi:hypothetical protein [Sorangium sp. So ce1335]|uniref:hypothetical protein n=1 Tax=Sorangium sp. So ce1335 TaxID=3133335 RepID=UPI003F60BC73